MPARILWIEGKRAESLPFIPDLQKKGYELEVVATGNAAVNCLSEFSPDMVIVNAASLRSSGKLICRSLRDQSNGIPILVISDPKIPADPRCANVVLTLPFTTRKLINRVVPLLPGEGKKKIHRGSILLDLELKKVNCQGRETRLTPRLAHLLKILLQNAGAVVDRKQLFREVWNTEYIEDTRTLDVHISWLREAIEENPRKPKFLKTLRGVGYRLDV